MTDYPGRAVRLAMPATWAGVVLFGLGGATVIVGGAAESSDLVEWGRRLLLAAAAFLVLSGVALTVKAVQLIREGRP